MCVCGGSHPSPLPPAPINHLVLGALNDGDKNFSARNAAEHLDPSLQVQVQKITTGPLPAPGPLSAPGSLPAPGPLPAPGSPCC